MKTPKSWTAVKSHLKDQNPAQLLSLLKDLYDLSTENQAFLNARTQGAETDSALELYRARVTEPFFPANGGFGTLKLSDAKTAIRHYAKATKSIPGTIELLLVYVETGTAFTNDFSDIDARFYDSLCAALDELSKLLLSQGAHEYGNVQSRLEGLAKNAANIGWGYGDHVTDVVGQLKRTLG
jgi:hypothetical protein